MIACDISAPTFTTTAAAGRNNGVHAGSVKGAIRTSPGSKFKASAGSITIRALPLAFPLLPAFPVKTSPDRAG